MHATYLKEYFPNLVENYSDDFLNAAKSTIIKNSPTENLGVGLIFLEKQINESHFREYIEGQNVFITENLEKLIENAFFTTQRPKEILFGLPSPAGNKERGGKLWFWFPSDNLKIKNFFGGSENNEGLEHRLEHIRIVYDIESDSFESRKEYCILPKKRDTYKNYTYTLDKNMKATLVNTQVCIHSYIDSTKANDVTGIVDKLDPNIYKFQSYRRSDNGNTGIYIGLKNRK